MYELKKMIGDLKNGLHQDSKNKHLFHHYYKYVHVTESGIKQEPTPPGNSTLLPGKV